ncbi:MAG: hypothetical protein PHW79_04930, partial [Candidatus Marinimicrobia bacterium]|nr:hypothetical protein [Candidatus Neomarinimicrobiota bacterium]
ALVSTRDHGVVDKNFPSNDFNHMIAYVPLRNDTLWLDCTSEYNTPENIPDMDEDAGALIIFDDRVQLTKIPVSSPERNQTLFKANIVIDEEGTAKVSGKYIATGDDDINLKEIFLSKDDEERRKTIINWLIEFSPDLTLESLSFANLENIHASTVIEFDCTARHYAELTRNRLFFNPNFFHRVIFKSEKPSERKSAVYYSYPFVCNDTITFVVPEKFLPESVRDTVSLCQSFGSFETKAVFSGGQVVYARKRSINQKKIDFSDYGAYYDFMEKIEKLDAAKMVFRK